MKHPFKPVNVNIGNDKSFYIENCEGVVIAKFTNLEDRDYFIYLTQKHATELKIKK